MLSYLHKTLLFQRLKLVIAIISLPLVLGAIVALHAAWQGNFHEITPGEAYRSAQLDRDEFLHYIGTYNIKSILNLRGAHPHDQWYTEEVKVSAEMNVAHYDVALSSSEEPTNDDVQKLLEIFASAPRPILIHCKAGADRSGLVAAIWKVEIDKEPKSEARKQLSILFGHVPIGSTAVLDRFFEGWRPSWQ